MQKLSITFAILLALTVATTAAQAQQPEERKDEKQPDPRKVPVPDARAQKEKAPSPVDDLKKKLSEREAEINRIRQEMLKEVEAEEKVVAEALKKAQDAVRTGGREAIVKLNELQMQRNQLQMLRNSIQNGQPIGGRKPVVPPGPVAPPALPVDLRLGIQVYPVGPAVMDQLGLPKDEGMVLARVDANSPAGKAGLKVHDILLKVDGKVVPSDNRQFLKILTDLKSDAPFEAVILRGGKQQTIGGLSIPAAALPKVGGR